MEPVKAISHGMPGGGLVLEWVLTAKAAMSEAHGNSSYRPESIKATGTIDGGFVSVQGSNDHKDPTAWFDLHDLNGDVLEIADEGLRSLRESTAWVRVKAESGDAKMAVVCKLFVQQL